jgi:hypothetical protein
VRRHLSSAAVTTPSTVRSCSRHSAVSGATARPGGYRITPTGKVGRVGLRFNVNPTRAVQALNGLTDNPDGLGRMIRQTRGGEMVIVQRDGCVKLQMCHVAIIGKSGYGKVKMDGAAGTSSGSSRRFICGLI